MRAVISKELRELIRLLPVGVVLIGVSVWFSLPQGLFGTQNIGLIPACASLFAIFLAAMQGLFDLSDRQRGFLFHRSVSRSKIMYGKVIAALFVYLIAVAIPLALLAVYFARMGLEYLPVHPVQVLPTLAICVAGFALHPATLIAIDREASWFGTRLLPLPLVILTLLIFAATVSDAGMLAVVIATLSLIVVAVCLLLGLQRGNFARKIVLVGGALTTVLAAIVFLSTIMESVRSRQPAPYSVEYGIDSEADLWVIQSRFDYSENGYVSIRVPVSGDRLRSDRAPNLNGSLPEAFAPESLGMLNRFDQNAVQQRYRYAGNIGRNYFVSAPPGVALVYDNLSSPPLEGYVSRSGFHQSADTFSDPFNGSALIYGATVSGTLVSSGYEPLWADRDGVYQFDRENGTVTALVELPIESAAVIVSANEAGKKVVRLFVETDAKGHLFNLNDPTGEATWFVNNQESRSRALPQLQAVEERTLPKLPHEVGSVSPMMGMTPDGTVIAFAAYNNFKRAVIANAPDAQWQIDQIIAPNLSIKPSFATISMTALAPPGALLIISAVALVYSFVNNLPLPSNLGVPDGSLPVMLLIGITAMIISISLVWILGRRRGFSTPTNVAWILATLLAGLASPLILVALYPRIHCEPCPRCERPRRIDRNTCSHCGTEWDTLQAEGIEIIDFVCVEPHQNPQLESPTSLLR